MGDFHLLFFASFPGALRSGSKTEVASSANEVSSYLNNGHEKRRSSVMENRILHLINLVHDP
jgi:hypothetical protein